MGPDKDGEPQDDYPRPDPDARGSEGPQLPLLEESEPEDEADAGTIDYESALEEDEEDWYADIRCFHAEGRRWRPRKPRTDDELAQALKAFMNRCVDQEQLEEGEEVDMQCEYEQISSGHIINVLAADLHNEYPVSFSPDDWNEAAAMRPDAAVATDSKTYVEMQLSPEMSRLYVPAEGDEVRKNLREGEFYVLQIYAGGEKKTVVEREHNILTQAEAQKEEKKCRQAMYDEIMRWHTLGAFKRMSHKLATNVIDARWVLKWKQVAGKKIIQARLVVRGFKDLQAAQLSTFAGTTSRWGQRIVNSVAVQKGWHLFTADVSQAFLRGLTLAQAAELKYKVHRSIKFTMPLGRVPMLQQLLGYDDFNPRSEMLEMLPCGVGIKGARRLWNKVLRKRC